MNELLPLRLRYSRDLVLAALVVAALPIRVVAQRAFPAACAVAELSGVDQTGAGARARRGRRGGHCAAYPRDGY